MGLVESSFENKDYFPDESYQQSRVEETNESLCSTKTITCKIRQTLRWPARPKIEAKITACPSVNFLCHFVIRGVRSARLHRTT